MSETKAKIPISRLIDYMDRKNLHCDFYLGCAEVGYDDKPMLCADWNPPEMEKIYDWVEKYYEGEIGLDWSDEWMGCSDCCKAVRSKQDSYGWEPSYLSSEDSISCRECADKAYHSGDGEELIEWYRNMLRGLPSWTKEMIKALGYSCLEDDDYCCKIYETGFHPGQNDYPEDVAKFIRENLPEHDFLFILDDIGQFDMKWSVFVRKRKD